MDEISGLIIKMTEFFSGDPKRIQHFIKVHTLPVLSAGQRGLISALCTVLTLRRWCMI